MGSGDQVLAVKITLGTTVATIYTLDKVACPLTSSAPGKSAAEHMASKAQTRDIASFFKPFTNSIPAKRPSPSFEDEDLQYIKTSPKQRENSAKRPSHSLDHEDVQYIKTTPKQQENSAKHPSSFNDEVQYVATKSKQPNLRTPHSAARFKHVNSSPGWSPIGPGSGSSVRIPIRSPKPSRPVTSFSSRLSAHYTDSQVRKRKDDVKSAQPAISQFSFADLPSSTQNIVKDGKIIAVKGSDDGDSDSLSSLDDILGLRKSEPVTSSSSLLELDADELEAERIRTMLRFTSGRSQPLVGRDKLRDLYSKERDHKVDIGALMGDHFDDQEVEENIAKAKRGYEAARQDNELSKAQADLDRNLLAAVVAGGPGEQDGLSRLMNAVERTEALNINRSWFFFGPGGPKSPSAESVEIATDRELSNWWRESLEDDDSRDRTFLSGFIGETWSSGRLPDEIIRWTFESIIQEPQNELRRSYVQAFKDVNPEWVRTHVSPSKIEQIFLRMGATEQAISCIDVIEPGGYVAIADGPPDYRYLLSIIELLIKMAPHLENSAYTKLLAILARLAVDADVMCDARTSVVVEDSLSELIELSMQKENGVIIGSFVADLGTCLKDPTLQAQLLRHMLCTSSVTAYTRIQLAYRFLFGTNSSSGSDLASWSIDINALTHYLDSGPFDTSVRSPSKRPDYTNMTALTYILDVAIANGGPPTSFSSRAEEIAFNRKVDKLADRMQAIFASIADTGASHLRRTEAKEALQALRYRLLYAVRTEPRPKKSVFGGRDGEEYRAEQRSKGFMVKFLARKKDKSSQAAGQRLIQNQSSQASNSESEDLIRRQLQLDV